MRQRGAVVGVAGVPGRTIPSPGSSGMPPSRSRAASARRSACSTRWSSPPRRSVVRTTATVGELLTAWFEFASPDFSPKTVKETRGLIDRNLMPALGAVPLARLKSSDLDRYYRSLIVSGGVGGRPLAPGTVKRIHGILRRALNQSGPPAAHRQARRAMAPKVRCAGAGSA